MNIELTPEMLLAQMKYTINDSALKQVEIAMNNTYNFDKFAKHLIPLNDNLKSVDGFLALSNTTTAFKIKCESQNAIMIEDFHTIVNKWSNKYNISLETIPNKNVYYIIGIK